MAQAKLWRNTGLFIAGKRRAKNFTQTQLGDLIGVHSAYISNIERGVSPTSEKYFVPLTIALDIDFLELTNMSLLDREERFKVLKPEITKELA